jgi:hypothetical protein
VTLFRSLAGLARAWWTVDRVRASPREGRLLRLAAGSAIRVRGEPAVVASRRVGRTADGPYVVYECDGVGGRSLLRLRPIGGTRRVTVQWTANGKEEALTEDEVDAYPVRQSPSKNAR